MGPEGLEPKGEQRAIRDSVFVRENTRTCCGAQGMKAQGERRAVRDSVLVRGCALCAGECRNAKARNVRWRFKKHLCALCACECRNAKARNVRCVFKSTCARFAQASAETQKHVTCDGVLKALVRALRRRVQERESTKRAMAF